MTSKEPTGLEAQRESKFKVNDHVIHKVSGETGVVKEINHYKDKDIGGTKFDVFVEVAGKYRSWMRETDLKLQSKETTNVKSTEGGESSKVLS